MIVVLVMNLHLVQILKYRVCFFRLNWRCDMMHLNPFYECAHCCAYLLICISCCTRVEVLSKLYQLDFSSGHLTVVSQIVVV